jgi:hypothetical protein
MNKQVSFVGKDLKSKHCPTIFSKMTLSITIKIDAKIEKFIKIGTTTLSINDT